MSEPTEKEPPSFSDITVSLDLSTMWGVWDDGTVIAPDGTIYPPGAELPDDASRESPGSCS